MRLITADSRIITDAALVVVLAALVLSGCAPPDADRLEVFESRFEQVQPGMTQSEVTALLGITFSRGGHYVLRDPDPEWGNFAWPGRPAPDALIDGRTYLAWSWRPTRPVSGYGLAGDEPPHHPPNWVRYVDMSFPRTVPEWLMVYFDGAPDQPREQWRVVAKHHDDHTYW